MKYIYKIHGSTAIYLDGPFDEVSNEDIANILSRFNHQAY